MVNLLPTTSEQEFNILPRSPENLTSLSLTITEEGSRVSETFADVQAFENDDWICIAQAFTILKENRLYEITIKQDGDPWWRGRARCTSQSDKTAKHTLNSVPKDGFMLLEDNDQFQTI